MIKIEKLQAFSFVDTPPSQTSAVNISKIYITHDGHFSIADTFRWFSGWLLLKMTSMRHATL